MPHGIEFGEMPKSLSFKDIVTLREDDHDAIRFLKKAVKQKYWARTEFDDLDMIVFLALYTADKKHLDAILAKSKPIDEMFESEEHRNSRSEGLTFDGP